MKKPSKPRKPRQKLTHYVINITPTEQVRILLRGRKKPRKVRLAAVQKFNEMVQKGKISGLKFNMRGQLIGAKKHPKKLTPKERKAIRTVIGLTAEQSIRKHLEKPAALKSTRWLEEYEQKGCFDFLHSTIEFMIAAGKSPLGLIQRAERQVGRKIPGLREKIKRLGTRQKVEKNLRIQLRFFEQLLKQKKQKKMKIIEEKSPWDKSTVYIKITPKGVVKESVAHFFDALSPLKCTIIIATLRPNGKIEWKEIVHERE